MLGSIPYTVQMYGCDWLNKKADWPIAEHNRLGQESQTGRMLGGRRAESGVTSQTQREQEVNVPC